MADFILTTGDLAMFNPTFGSAIVTVIPGNLTGTGKGMINKKMVCVDGDEKTVMVPGCPYITASHPIPGVGMLSIASLGADQKAKRTKSNNKPVLLKGSTFTAKFQVMAPAQQPTPAGPIPDPAPQYSGTGTFITTNMRVKGT
ncbi:hypothetical protein PN441_05120 [Spirulina major CS-329]|uniref:hypothetical protein n=1 Tax=Spirulina TaxID=1154 RepID=UPI0023314C67|nr:MULTISPECIES: hypothetical protein [Spirulina]MDB9496266.1 hypothetical protein [Spirulina subsalsa CS-330]MDB9502445.1 hypothetical protein [Spirulina major CS-329]